MTLREMMKEPSSGLTFIRKGDRSSPRGGFTPAMVEECTWVSKKVDKGSHANKIYSLVSIRDDIAALAFGDNLKDCRFEYAVDYDGRAFYAFLARDGFRPQSAKTKLTLRLQSNRLPVAAEFDRALTPSASIVTVDGMKGIKVDLRNQPIKWGE